MKTLTDQKLVCGNEAIAEAALQAGCRFYAGYPITPQNELCAYMARRMPELGGTFIQAESELAAISMVHGATAAGARAMTSSSSPGISLKQEGISYLAASELPAVIVNMSRGGPGLGNIAPAQSDYFQATRGGGHGDYRTIVLGPASVREAMQLTRRAFDLADTYRMPAMVLGDGLLGQMMEPVGLDEWNWQPPETAQPIPKPWALTGCVGRKPNILRSLYLEDGRLERLNKDLERMYTKIECKEVMHEEYRCKDATVIFVAFGLVSRITRACVDALRDEGIAAGLFRPITLWPFPSIALAQYAASGSTMCVCEMNMGQMVEDVRLAVGDKVPVHFYGRSGGAVPEEEDIIQFIKDKLDTM